MSGLRMAVRAPKPPSEKEAHFPNARSHSSARPDKVPADTTVGNNRAAAT